MKRFLDTILYSVFVGNALFFIWSNRYLPLQDYPDWVYQGHLFTSYLKGILPQNYHLITYPVPYTAVTFIMGLFGLVFQPETAGKIVLTLYTFLFISGSFYLLTSFRTSLSKPLLYVPCLYICNHIFFGGCISYIFSLGILSFCIGYVLRTFLDNQRWNPFFIFASSLVLFFSHGFVYITWLFFLFVLMIFLRRHKRALINIIVGCMPSLVLAAAYYFLKDSATNVDVAHLTGLKAVLLHKISGPVAYFSPIHEFSPFLDSNPNLMFPILINMIFCLFIAGLAILWLLKLKECASSLKAKYLLAMVLLLSCLFLLSPPVALSIDAIDQRFLYPLLFCFLASLSQISLSRWRSRLLKLFLIVIVLIQAVYLNTHVSKMSVNMEEVMSTLRSHVQNSDFLFIDEGHFRFDNGYKRTDETNGLIQNVFIPRHQHLCLLTSLLSLELGKETPIFPVGLFSYRGKKKWITSVQDIKEMGIQPENYVILGGNGGNAVIAEALSPDYAMGLKGDHFILMTKR